MEKAFFYVYETVDFPLQLISEDPEPILEGLKNIIVSLGQYNTLVLEKDMSSPDIGVDDENDTINLHLTQDDTAKFKPNEDVLIQVNILYDNHERDTTAQATVRALANLHENIME